jgi:hypothetical protein
LPPALHFLLNSGDNTVDVNVTGYVDFVTRLMLQTDLFDPFVMGGGRIVSSEASQALPIKAAPPGLSSPSIDPITQSLVPGR